MRVLANCFNSSYAFVNLADVKSQKGIVGSDDHEARRSYQVVLIKRALKCFIVVLSKEGEAVDLVKDCHGKNLAPGRLFAVSGESSFLSVLDEDKS
jgi:hypothetical protein